MPYTVTAPASSITVAGTDSCVDDPVRAYESYAQAATYEVSVGTGSSPYVITSQGQE